MVLHPSSVEISLPSSSCYFQISELILHIRDPYGHIVEMGSTLNSVTRVGFKKSQEMEKKKRVFDNINKLV